MRLETPPLSVASSPFDPLGDLIVAQSSRPAELGTVNLRALTPFQRALLVIDGTVTKFIEAYTMEPVEVVRLAQETKRLGAEHPWLETVEGAEVAVRQVLLQGRYSGTFHAYAASLIMLERLPEGVRRSLDAEDHGLGRILNDQSIETRREILWYGREAGAELPEAVRRRADGEFVSRTYRIIASGRPLMLIHEKFPAVMDKSPAHH